MNEHELIMKFSASIKRASGAARGLLHHQQNWSFNAIVDTLDLIHTMTVSLATANAMNQHIKASLEKKK